MTELEDAKRKLKRQIEITLVNLCFLVCVITLTYCTITKPANVNYLLLALLYMLFKLYGLYAA